ncbi:MAG: sigma-54 interaction domain-containing protein [Anaerovoracaceae bacterium]
MNEVLMDLIINNVHEGIYVLNNKGDYIYCNNMFLTMTGGSREEILKINAYELLEDNSKYGRVTVSAGVEALRQKRIISLVNEVVTPKKFKYKQLITATPVFDEFGDIEYVIVETTRVDLLQKRYQRALAEVEAFENDGNIISPTKLEEEKNISSLMVHGRGGVMDKLEEEIKVLAKTDISILITGETGTGKEVVTQYIHSCSRRKNKPLIEINCADFPESLLEAELYGYVKGAFTGARNEGKVGLIEKADGGTLFLDEINSMPVALQGKLLRVLETHKIKRLGSVDEKEIDFRLITATNKDLYRCVEEGTFREDLFYRISVAPVLVPPLRKRKEDIMPLVEYFLNEFSKRYGIVKTFGQKAMQQMIEYSWPGNVRELRNVVERVVVTGQSSSMEIEQLAETVLNGTLRERYVDFTDKYESDRDTVPDLFENENNQWDNFSLSEYLEKCEKNAIEKALAETDSTYKAAELLKVNQSTVFRKKQKYGL